MAYTLDQFLSDCHAAIASDKGPGGREKVRQNLEKLLKNEDFVKTHCDALDYGVHELYRDKELDFIVLSHVYEEGRQSPPHDHGHSWAVYGQARFHTDMTVWERKDDGTQDGFADIKIARRFRLDPAMAGTFEPGVIHQINFPKGARFVRVTGTDLNTIETHRFDADQKKMFTNKGMSAGAAAQGAMRSAS
ncbi:MAG: hypothetical protein FJX67_02905 [Alphaproteobacteria bacterium]|nr:hypothetical protein [Alphaproteobacteria bacterium]